MTEGVVGLSRAWQSDGVRFIGPGQVVICRFNHTWPGSERISAPRQRRMGNGDPLKVAPSFTGLSPSSDAQSRAKRANPSRDTRPELLLRRELWKRGARYRLHRRDLVGKPDIAFIGAHVAVFCDGDFWHGKGWPDAEQRLARGSNAGYWRAKIAYNRERDQQVTGELMSQGWCVLRFWESEIRTDASVIADRVMSLVHLRVGPS